MATQQLNRLAGLLGSAYTATRLGVESDADLLNRCRTTNDRAAFEALVRRHGPRVLAACRKVLTDPADVDDAFQATFLVLLQKPRAVRKANAVGPWLYGVAHRIAVRARDLAARRRTLLKRVPATDQAPAGPDLSWRDACAVLHAELDRLPDTLRLPLVLCYLEGLSRDEAAHQLGWTINEVRGRLERGRDRLRKRLEKRGIALSAGLLAAAAGGGSVTAAGPPTRLIESVLSAVAGRPTGRAAALARGACPTMFPAKFTLLSALVLVAGIVAGAGTRDPNLHAQPKADPAKPAAKDAGPAKADEQPPEFAGRVVDPSDKPVAGAKIRVVYYTPNRIPIPVRATTDGDGRFRFTLKAADFDRSYQAAPWHGSHVVATADGYAVGWAIAGKERELTIRLVKDDKPLAGRLLSLEGRPLVGVKVLLVELLEPQPGKDLAAFVPELKKRKSGYEVQKEYFRGFEGVWIGFDIGALFPPVTTGADGRFTLPGVGPDRVVTLRFEAPSVEGRSVRVFNRESETVTVPEWDQGGMGRQPTMTFVGNNFDFALAPGRTVQGTVRDKATGKPIAGARVVSEQVANHNVAGRDEFQATADRDGKFVLHGLPLGRGNVLRAAPPDGQPYLPQLRDVPVPLGANPAPVDFELTRGVTLTVQVIDKATKAPVTAMVEYFTFPDNPALKEIKGFTVSDNRRRQTQAARHEIVVPPGPGLVAVRSMEDRFPVAVGLDQFKDRMQGPFINTRPHFCHPTNFHMLVPVEPKADAHAAEVEVGLDAGPSVKGRVLGPDGKPLAGTIARGLKSAPLAFGAWEKSPLAGADFEVVGVDPKKPRMVLFLHRDKKLAGPPAWAAQRRSVSR
ncbi:MAG TPA: sigma-70 family RNA polymerase sigma factor [Gemmataceae bacterium]|nr:sigma-70 family RNA polymerase sigma factor [Gemmataceae bacterium]